MADEETVQRLIAALETQSLKYEVYYKLISMRSWLSRSRGKVVAESKTFHSIIRQVRPCGQSGRKIRKGRLLRCKRNISTNWCGIVSPKS